MQLTGDERLDLDRILWHAQLVIAAKTGGTPAPPGGKEWEMKTLGVDPKDTQLELQRWRNRLASGE